MESHWPDDPDEPLLAGLYSAMREIARRLVRPARDALDPTELVHEAFVRLARSDAYSHLSRTEFLALAATVLRRLLVDQARRRETERRGGGWRRLTLSELATEEGDGALDLVDLDAALARLAAVDARQARIVELRFFGGLTGDEVATLLGLSRRMVTREWTMARAWLKRELGA